MTTSLQAVLLLLAAAVLVVVVFRSLKLPPLLGYLAVGIAIGPHALGFIRDTPETHALAEFGVVFLMFSIGLEFSLPRLVSMRRIVFGLGTSQVAITLAAAAVLLPLALPLDWRAGLLLGGALAMSSTAIVIKMLADRLELDSGHGRQIVGILLFQDLAVVPLLILVPALARPAGELAPALAIAGVKAAVALSLLLGLGQRPLRAWFHLIARQYSPELFILNVLLITLGLAYITHAAGLSLALGAFVAGMLISETEYRYQVEDDIKPFRDVLLGLFFVTIGMRLDLGAVIGNLGWVLVALIAMLVFKGALIAGLCRAFGNGGGAALRIGLDLAQVGEFAFVLLAQPGAADIIPAPIMQPVLAAMLLSMLIAPFLIEYSERIVRHTVGAEWLSRAMELHQIAVKSMAVDNHVVICGYGRCGQNLARMLDQESIGYFALDLDPARIHDAAAAGDTVVYGDAGRREVLIAAGLTRARALVITFHDPHVSLRVLAQVHSLRPDLPVVVRTLDDTYIDRLEAAGASEVVAEVMEGSLMLASHALMLLGVPVRRVLRRVQATRESRYHVLRGVFIGGGLADADGVERPHARLHSVFVVPDAPSIGRSLGELALAELGIEVTAIRRRGVKSLAPAQDTRIEQGDVVVLFGSEESIAAAEIRLLQGALLRARPRGGK
ncbi:MAG: cation:proton antiporter [Burkholderiales bacterium]|nr:cation:proton antiporter [Burkholderiales bacterium]